jgi:xylulokinase
LQLLMGIDVGSSGCKVVAIDADGRVTAAGSFGYETRYPAPGYVEQDPEDWYAATCRATRECLEVGGVNPGDVVAVSVDGPAHSAALLDGAGKVIYPTIHTTDMRSVPQAVWLETELGERVFDITCQRSSPSWTLAHLLWIMETEPEVWARLRRVSIVKDYVRGRLTGDYYSDTYDAIGTQLYDARADSWSEELCTLIGWPADWLPEVRPAFSVAGPLRADAARDTGLLAGTPVAVGSGESVVEAFGVGVVEPGQSTLKLATAANVNRVTSQPYPSRKSLTYRHLIEGLWFSIAATNSGTSSMNWLRKTFYQHEVKEAEAAGLDVYQLMEEMIAGAAPGCEGLLFHPYLVGERSPYWDPLLRADFVGISVRHKSQHFARAVMEGVCFSMRDCLEAVEGEGEPTTERRVIGGGAKSPIWRQILCDVIGQRLVKPAVEDAAFGAAMLAGVAVGVFNGWADAVKRCVRIEGELEPDVRSHELYSEYFKIYRAVVHDLREYNHRLAELAAREGACGN